MKINFSEKTIDDHFPSWFRNSVCYVSEDFAEENNLTIRKVWLNFVTNPGCLDLLVDLFSKHKFKVNAYDLRPMPSWGLEISDEVIVQLKLKFGGKDYFEVNDYDEEDDNNFSEEEDDED